jgi:opacity protein-like surface antigen
MVEVSAGYTFMRDLSDDLPEDVNFPLGWYGSTTVNVTKWFGIVGEGTGSYKNDLNLDLGGYAFSNDARVYTLMGGPRFSATLGRFRPYAQVLAGGAHLRLKTTFPSELLVGTMSQHDTEFAFQPGGGLAILLNEHVGVKVAGDYRCIIDFVKGDGNEYSNEFRLLTGFMFNWGTR